MASGSKLVGAVTGTTSHIEELVEGKESFMAGVVMPLSVLGSGSETEEEVSPLTVSHLHWECTLLGLGAGKPITVSSMLDSSMHIVLIDNALVEKLGLHHFHLHKLVPISVALNNAATTKTQLHEYIKIAPFSPNSAWTSWTIKAVVTPNLCVSVLLGLPFLSVNHIVADFKKWTVIDKRTSYNLLQPLSPKTRKGWVIP